MGPHRMKPGEKIENPGKVLARVLKFVFKNYALLYCIVLVCVVVNAVATLMGSLFLKSLIDDYITPMLTSGSTDFAPLLAALLKMAGIFLLGIAASFGQQRIMVNIGQGSLKGIRKMAFDHMETLPIRYFDQNQHGSIMSVYTNDVDTLRQLISNSIPEVLSTIITVAVTLTSMIVLSIPLTLVSLAMIAVSMIVSIKLAKKSGGYFMQQQKNLATLNGHVEEMINGQKVVKVFCHEEQSINDFEIKNEELRAAANNANGIVNIIMPINGNIGHISYVLIATVGSLIAINSGGTALTLGIIVSFLTLNKNLSRPISQISAQINNIVMAMAGAKRIFDIIDEPSEIDDGDTVLGDVRGEVVFNHVDFEYRKDHLILHDISLYAKPGQKIAFVGSTGAGKTTITNLINRFYDIVEGEITYDGIDIKKIKKDSLRKSLGIVLQETNLFTGTVMENIRYGKLEASDEDCIAAAKLVGSDSFIKRLPDGYNTVLKGDGSNLSQGQRQLLSITRAAVKDPAVLILDEATSSVDTRTEKLVQQGMDKLMEGRTTFVIAHRLSTVKNANCIMVLEKGRIIERGTHEELLDMKGKYYNLYEGNFEEND